MLSRRLTTHIPRFIYNVFPYNYLCHCGMLSLVLGLLKTNWLRVYTVYMYTTHNLICVDAAEQAAKDKAEERRAVQESAAAAVKAVIKRADVETENEKLLGELIDIKVNFSNMSVDFDRELKRNATLKKRLQVYAERVAKLEFKNTRT